MTVGHGRRNNRQSVSSNSVNPKPQGASEMAKNKPYSGRKRTPASFGCANIDIDGVEAAPVDFFIGNTNPNIDEQKVTEVIVKCASQVDGKPDKELKAEEIMVKCLSNLIDIPNPRTNCWSITVPHIWRDAMKKDDFYPRGWSHRVFHHGRPRRNHLDQNKRTSQEHHNGAVEQIVVDNQTM